LSSSVTTPPLLIEITFDSELLNSRYDCGETHDSWLIAFDTDVPSSNPTATVSCAVRPAVPLNVPLVIGEPALTLTDVMRVLLSVTWSDSAALLIEENAPVTSVEPAATPTRMLLLATDATLVLLLANDA
jgi:hypothetical protein